jgi:hypothetical protein
LSALLSLNTHAGQRPGNNPAIELAFTSHDFTAVKRNKKSGNK